MRMNNCKIEIHWKNMCASSVSPHIAQLTKQTKAPSSLYSHCHNLETTFLNALLCYEHLESPNAEATIAIIYKIR